MSFIDQEIIKRAQSYSVDGVSPLVFYKRFLDDILMIWLGSHQHLHSFFQDINKINPSIKFSLEHTKKLSDPDHDSCSCPLQDSVPFLDTSLSVRNGHINSDLYKKKNRPSPVSPSLLLSSSTLHRQYPVFSGSEDCQDLYRHGGERSQT